MYLSSRKMWRRFALTLLLLLAASLLLTVDQSASPVASSAAPRTVFVHLFEWKWSDIAKECETYLGPKGYAGVQISPPSEHAVVNSSGNYPWWERYQTVSYNLDKSRSGTKAELQDMINRCRAVGVDIYADAVINHMTGGSGTGSNGTVYTKYNYPGTYSDPDFHSCRTNINGSDYTSDPWRVQNCELVGLADLNTGSDYVRGRIATYLISLANMGVKGFRFDASKHMAAVDIDNIISRVNAGTSPAPYFYLEVIDRGGEAISASDYYNVNGGQADINEFKYGQKLGNKFLNTTYSGGREKLAELRTFGESWGMMPSDKGIVFSDNHDMQRDGHPYVTYKDGKLYDLENVFMLAWPYGYPQVMSSFAFSYNDQGPPSDANGNTNSIYPAGSSTPNCFNEWKCEHRWRPIGNMVAFRNYTSADFRTTNWWDNGDNQIAFSRGGKGFVVINRQDNTSLSRTFETGLPAGTYCDVIHGDFSNGSCSGPTITVNGSGLASISVNAWDAVAIYGGARLGGEPAVTSTVTFNENATTTYGQNVYLVGNIAALGSWNTGAAIPLSASAYPNWTATLSLPVNTAVEYKYIKKDGAGTVIWESGTNRAFNSGPGGGLTFNDTWR